MLENIWLILTWDIDAKILKEKLIGLHIQNLIRKLFKIKCNENIKF